jgi:hypothetical protein
MAKNGGFLLSCGVWRRGKAENLAAAATESCRLAWRLSVSRRESWPRINVEAEIAMKYSNIDYSIDVLAISMLING